MKTHFLLTLFLCTASAFAGSPTIFENSYFARAGDTFFLQGSGFGSDPSVEFAYNDDNWMQANVQTASATAITAQLPTRNLPDIDLLTVRVSADRVNWSSPVYINQARPIHFGTDSVAPGMVFQIFGRNLMFGRTPGVRFVDSTTGESLAAAVNTQASSVYMLLVTSPTGLTPGHKYEVFVTNGYNGNQQTGGETQADATLACRAVGSDFWQLGVAWAGDFDFYANRYNVTSDPRLSLHAVGDGTTDNLAAINAAIQVAANANGGVVYLPAGRFRINVPNGCGIVMAPRVVLAGAGNLLTTVTYGYGPPPPGGGLAVCFANSQSGIADMTFTNVNESKQFQYSAATASSSSEVFLQRVTWNLDTSMWLTLENVTDLAIENSTITETSTQDLAADGPVDFAGCTHVLFRNNTVQFSDAGVELSHTNDVVIEDSHITRNATIALDQANVTHVLISNFAKGLAIVHNRFDVVGSGLYTHNDGEVIGAEGGGLAGPDEFRGIISSATTATITDPTQHFSITPGVSVVAIVSGTGAGQWRTITAVSPNGTLSLQTPWQVVPTPGAHYAVFDWAADQWTVADNTLIGNEKGIEWWDASVHDVFVGSNTLLDDGGILISPSEQAPRLFGFVSGVEIINNKVSDVLGERPAYIGIIPREDGESTGFGLAVNGAEIRNNAIIAHTPNTFITNYSYDDSKAVAEGIDIYWQWQTPGALSEEFVIAPVLATVVEGNSLSGSDTGIYLNSGAYQTTIVSTIASDVTTFEKDDVLPGMNEGSAQTVITQGENLTSVFRSGARRVVARATLPNPETAHAKAGDVSAAQNEASRRTDLQDVSPTLSQRSRSMDRRTTMPRSSLVRRPSPLGPKED